MTFLPPTKSPSQIGKFQPSKGGKKKFRLFSTTESELMGQTPSTVDGFQTLFLELVQLNLKKDWPNFVKFVPVDFSSAAFSVLKGDGLNSMNHVVTLEEFMDFTTMKEGELINPKVRDLALKCAGAYDAMVTNAKTKGGTDPVDGGETLIYVPQLFSSLKFRYAESSSSLSLEDTASWVAYRFKFAFLKVEN